MRQIKQKEWETICGVLMPGAYGAILDAFREAGIRVSLYPFCLYLLSRVKVTINEAGEIEVLSVRLSLREIAVELLGNAGASNTRKVSFWRLWLKQDQTKSGVQLIWPEFGESGEYKIAARLILGILGAPTQISADFMRRLADSSTMRRATRPRSVGLWVEE